MYLNGIHQEWSWRGPSDDWQIGRPFKPALPRPAFDGVNCFESRLLARAEKVDFAERELKGRLIKRNDYSFLIMVGRAVIRMRVCGSPEFVHRLRPPRPFVWRYKVCWNPSFRIWNFGYLHSYILNRVHFTCCCISKAIGISHFIQNWFLNLFGTRIAFVTVASRLTRL